MRSLLQSWHLGWKNPEAKKRKHWKRCRPFPPNKPLLLSPFFVWCSPVQFVYIYIIYIYVHAAHCKEQLAIEEERISEKYAQEEAEARGNLSKNALVKSFGDCSKWIASRNFSCTFPHQAAENLRKKSKKSRRREDEALVDESPRCQPTSWVGGG